MFRATTLIIAACICHAMAGCPADQCYGNNDCIEGYACKKNGECIKVDPLTIETQSIPDAIVDESYQETFQASGGIAPYSWTIESDQNWPSMQSTSGTLSGTPSTPAQGVIITVTVTDFSYDGQTAEESYTMDITWCQPTQSNHCNGQGECLEANGECDCYQGYDGSRCENCAVGYHDLDGACVENIECYLNYCSQHGNCDDSDGFPICTCYDNWGGENCEECVWFPCLEQTKLTNPNPYQHNVFGTAVATNSSYVVVGAPGDGNVADEARSVYVFKRPENGIWDNWTRETAPGTISDAWFGYAVALSPDYLVVGAPYDDGIVENGGAVYTFYHSGDNNWSPATRIVSPIPEPNECIGSTVSISGQYLAVGTWALDLPGKAYVFRLAGVNTWDSGTILEPPAAEDGFGFGYSVSISGDYLVVGAPADTVEGVGTGAAYVYHRTGGNSWNDVAKLVASDRAQGDAFGLSVAISGDYVAVGAQEGDGMAADTGAVYVFLRVGENEWDAGTKLVATDGEPGDGFGHSVGIDEHVIVGAPFESSQGDSAGAAYVFRRTGISSWDSGTKIVTLDAEALDGAGWSVAIEDMNTVIGAWHEDSGGDNSGAAYVY